MTRSGFTAALVIAAVGGFCHRAAAQAGDACIHAPQADAARRRAPMVIDGRLDDPDWLRIAPVADFRQRDPDEGAPATQRTEVRFAYDDDALYIAARMYDAAGASGVETRLARRDAAPVGDYIMFVFDTYHDHAGRTVLRVDASGVQYDALGLGRSNPDPGWDAVWEAETRVDSLGWTAELRIPFSELRLAATGPQTWGLQMWRYEQRVNETSQWAFWSKRENGGATCFGHLTGIAPSRRAISIAALPYFSAGVQPARPAGVAIAHGSSSSAVRERGRVDAGGELLVHAPGANATISLNPDFGQVEADPAIVNLTALETFYPEKRPFFLQDAGVFAFGDLPCFECAGSTPLQLYYSRRIGRAPSLQPPGTLIEEPSAAAIIGAARVTSQSRDGWTVGALAARTAPLRALVLDSTGITRRATQEPTASFGVVRLVRQSASGSGSAGVIGTLTNRAIDDGFGLSHAFASRSANGGGDIDRWWADHSYHLSATAALSSVAGDSLALSRIQTSSVHDFQRPGRVAAGGVFDSHFSASRRLLNGYAASARIAKDAGAWLWEGQAEDVSAGFEANDLGFIPIAGETWLAGNVRRQFTKPTRWYHEADVTIGAESVRNADGDPIQRGEHASLDVTTPRYWTWRLVAQHLPAHYDDRLLRGGPTVAIASGDSAELDVSSDSRRTLSGATRAWFGTTGSGDSDAGISPAVTLRPNDALELSAGAQVQRLALGSQLVDVAADTTAGSVAGKRYMVGRVRQHTVSVNVRAAAAITRALSFDLYAQSLATDGRYDHFGQFAAPRSCRRSAYGESDGSVRDSVTADGRRMVTVRPSNADASLAFAFPDPTGASYSLRGTAVLRWEFRPGSALIIAWTQVRVGADGLPLLELARAGHALATSPAANAVLVKATFRLRS